MSAVPEILRTKLDSLPNCPGIYMFKDGSGEIIYIGKASRLNHRVRSYFGSRNDPNSKEGRIVARIADLELMVTDSEVEALILEANLVREHKPRYNIFLKDDKHFPYIKVTTEEIFPRILIVRKIGVDKSRYFG